MGVTTVKLEIHVPESHLKKLMDALSEAGAGVAGLYDYVFAVSRITGYWRAHEHATPYRGNHNQITQAEEMKVETYCSVEKLPEVLQAIYKIHPYETPAINVLPLLDTFLE